MGEASVGVVLGSREDLAVMERGLELLRELGVGHTVDVMSAHADPDVVRDWARGAADAGYRVVIAGDGRAGALPAAVAAHTLLPVIGVPFRTPGLNGVDALYAMAQAGEWAPVATVGLDDTRSAVALACRLLAVDDSDLARRLRKLADERAGRDREHRSWPGAQDDRGTGFGFQPR